MIVLIDDDPADLEILTRAFAQVGTVPSEIRTYSDPVEAFEEITGSGLDPVMVITDLKMPRLDGAALIQRLRAEERLAPVCIVLSTSAEPGDVRRCFAAGANAYHKKPMSFTETTVLAQALLDYWFTQSVIPGTSYGVESRAYLSAALVNISTEDLVVDAARRNRSLGLTGFVAAHDGLYFQYLEGPADNLSDLWTRIMADRRHEVKAQVRWPASRRRFPTWSMQELGTQGVVGAAVRELALVARERSGESMAEFRDLALRTVDEVGLVTGLSGSSIRLKYRDGAHVDEGSILHLP